jgi:tetratricopeptide (TPR) repeat protein
MNAQYSKLAAAVLALVVSVSAAAAQDSWIGRRVMPREDAELKVGNQVIPSDAVVLPMKVERVQGDWLWVGPGWILKRHVVPVENAAAYYSDLLRRDRTDPWAWNLRGLTRHEMGDNQGALRDYTEAIRLNPNNAWYYLNRADVRIVLGDFKGAESDLDAAPRVEPNNAVVHYDVAMYLYDLVWDEGSPEEYDKIIEHFTAAIRLDPSMNDAYVERAYAYWDKGDLQRAAEDFNQVIRLFPDEINYYRDRGDVRWDLGDSQGALADYEYVLQQTNESERSYSDYDHVAWILATCPHAYLRNGARAIELATRACEMTEWKNWEPIDSLAAGYAETGDFGAAIQWQTKAIELATDEADKEVAKERLALYQQGKPYRYPLPTETAPAAPLATRGPA